VITSQTIFLGVRRTLFTVKIPFLSHFLAQKKIETESTPERPNKKQHLNLLYCFAFIEVLSLSPEI
jgi:hypothetical protein